MAAFTVISAICIPVVLLARYLQLTLIEKNSTFDPLFLLEMLTLMLFLSYFTYILGISRMIPRMTVYGHGLTRFTIPIFTNREGDFVAFADMESFSISKDQRTCAIMLHSEDSYMLWTSFNLKHILPVVDALRKNGITETK